MEEFIGLYAEYGAMGLVCAAFFYTYYKYHSLVVLLVHHILYNEKAMAFYIHIFKVTLTIFFKGFNKITIFFFVPFI